MKKLPAIFHLRALPACLLCLIAGILFVGIDVWWITCLCFVVFAAVLVVLVCFAPKRKALGVLCLACLALSLVTLAWSAFLSGEIRPTEGDVTVEGRVSEVQTDGDGALRALVLDDLVVDGEAYLGKMTVTPPHSAFWYAEEVDGIVAGRVVALGERVQVQGKAHTITMWYYDSYSVHNVLARRYYTLSATDFQPLDAPVSLSAVEKVQLGLYRLLRRNMGATAGFAFAFLTGNTCYVAPALLGDFRSTGTAHLLAVSGLHVGVLAGVLLWLLKKCRCPVWIRPLALGAVLGVYAWLCGASPSVMRASILVVVGATASALGRRRDPPSLLALTALLILAVQPLYLFDVSFLLSFSAYTGVVLLFPPLRDLMRRLPTKAGDSLSLGLSVSASITPISTYFFGGFSLLTLPLNLLLIPVMSVVYVVLFLGAILATIPHFGFVLVAVSYLLRHLFVAEAFLGGVGCVATSTAVWMLPLFYGGTALYSEYCLLPKHIKYTFATAACVVVMVLSICL